MFHVSFAHKNVQIGDALWLFPKASPDRFAWIALLAYRRVTLSHDGGWVSRDDIARLPKWSGKTRKHIGDNVARYLMDLERVDINVVEWKRRSTGPYRLTEAPAAVSFDIPLGHVEETLCITPLRPEIQRDDLIRFVPRFVHAELLFQRGSLNSSSTGGRIQSAHSILTDLVRDYPANSRLQLIAILAAIRVLFRTGRFGAARETLLQYEETVTGGKGRGSSWFIFIGHRDLRDKVPLADWDKVVEEHKKIHSGNARVEVPGPYPAPGWMGIALPIPK